MNKSKIIIKKSVVLVGLESEKAKFLIKEIDRFDLSNSTPIDCMNFLRKLKGYEEGETD